MEKYNEKDGVWRTIGGRRVFIKKGQSMSDAMKESGKFKSASKTETDTSNNVKEETLKKDEKEQEEYIKENQPAGEKTRQLIQDSKVKTFADEIKEQAKDVKTEESERLEIAKDIVKELYAMKDDNPRLEKQARDLLEPPDGYVLEKGETNYINSEGKLERSTESLKKWRDELKKSSEENKDIDLSEKQIDKEFTRQELKDRYGTDDVDLINAGREKENRVSLKEDSKGQKVVDSRKNDYDASSKLDKTDATKLQMGWGMSDDAVKGYAREQSHGINDKNVNNILSQLNDEGSDFTFGDARIEDGKIKTDVSVFMPDERGMVNRELEIPINKEDSNIHSIEAKIRDWQSRHSSPDTFYDKDFSDSAKSTNETMNDAIRVKASRSSLYKSRPESKEIESQGTSNRKEVSNNIQAHILDYYDSPKDFIQQMEAMGTSNMWKAGEEIAKGGSYLIYNGDMSDFLNELKINPKGKNFSEDKAFDMYTSLIGRESARLYEKLKKEESQGRSFNDSLRRKAYQKYLKEHPASKLKFNEFVKNIEE